MREKIVGVLVYRCTLINSPNKMLYTGQIFPVYSGVQSDSCRIGPISTITTMWSIIQPDRRHSCRQM